MKHVLLAILVIMSVPLYGDNRVGEPLAIQLKAALPNGVVQVRVTNTTSELVRIWRHEGNSWGWGIWYFEFFNEAELAIVVRKPNEGFTVNMPAFVDIRPGDGVNLTFDLGDGSWVSHRLPVFNNTWMRGTTPVKGCMAVLAIPASAESKRLGVWTGVITSRFY